MIEDRRPQEGPDDGPDGTPAGGEGPEPARGVSRWIWPAMGALVAAVGVAEPFVAFAAIATGNGGDAAAVLALVGIMVNLMPFAPWGLYRAVRTGRRPAAAAALVGVLLAVVTFPYEHDVEVEPVWQAQPDRPSDARGIGAWLDGGILVRARADAVVGYRVDTGEVAWRWTPPGRDTVCTMSEATGDGVGLVGHSAHGKPCATVTALVLATGTARWAASVDAPGRSGDDAVAATAAIAGGLAVLQENGGWRAAALADGRTLWQARTEPGCTPLALAGAPAAVVTVARCGEAAPVLRTLRPADGQEQTRAELPVSSRLKGLALLAADPVTLWVDEEAGRGTHAVLGYARDGRLRSTVPVSGPEFDLVVQPGSGLDDTFPARPAYGAVVVGDLLVAPAVKPDDITFEATAHGTRRRGTGRLVAFSLADGTRRWTAGVDESVEGVAADGGTVWALTHNSLYHFAAPTGSRQSKQAVPGHARINPVVLWPVIGGRFALVAHDGTGGEPPVTVLH
ncbi:PQQ-binding-like beta-propeller repeat protein [Kitasatospora sp. NPDC056181]|uniref:outer membrane protein assembly factor BamB family protein n=1 Tax=Kitasatospora sp. NPDC056181 TaxID=3345737 RepID=UPI0035DAB714